MNSDDEAKEPHAPEEIVLANYPIPPEVRIHCTTTTTLPAEQPASKRSRTLLLPRERFTIRISGPSAAALVLYQPTPPNRPPSELIKFDNWPKGDQPELPVGGRPLTGESIADRPICFEWVLRRERVGVTFTLIVTDVAIDVADQC